MSSRIVEGASACQAPALPGRPGSCTAARQGHGVPAADVKAALTDGGPCAGAPGAGVPAAAGRRSGPLNGRRASHPATGAA
jgi:hypothetical protein